ncbi:MAG: DUF4124 domain-containing protein [Dokdonella sp.]|uniref:DUF4124 domain-containing protein n=1 Tax=Dokdonella sp. TaxID=2291710 RepID=UPI003262DF68
MGRTDRHLRTGAICFIMVFALIHAAFAQSIYKCRDARGGTAYQDHVCSDPSGQTHIEIAPSPSSAVAATREVVAYTSPGDSTMQRAHARASSRARPRGHEALSYECRAANGEVFYRHSSCPKSISTQDIARAQSRGKRSAGDGRAEVSAVPLSRAEACRRLAASGGRAGHARDEQVSTYERNAGRDPCRRS